MRALIFNFFLIITLLIAGGAGIVTEKKVAPDFTLKDLDGKEVSLKDFKGKVVYLDIWATWCAPCIAEMNKAKSLKERFKDNKDVVFLYVSIDKDPARWKEFVKKKDIKGVHLNSFNGEESGILQKYDVPGIPRFVLIDQEGNIADWEAKWPSDSELVQDIERLLVK